MIYEKVANMFKMFKMKPERLEGRLLTNTRYPRGI